MLTNVISSFVPKKSTVLKLISWKHSFKRLNEEYEIAKKKKQALDNLFETGRISQSTRDSFNGEIVAAIAEIEKQQQDLLAKIQLKTQELESQIKTLETLLANYEIQHAVGEIDEEIYQREVNLLATGLETAKHELDVIKEAANQLCSPASAPVTEPSLPQESEAAPAVQDQPVENAPIAPAEVEVAAAPDVAAEPVAAEPVAAEPAATEPCPQEPVATIAEAAPEPEQPPVENAEAVPAETPQAVEETPQEPAVIIEEAAPEITPAENAEAVPVELPQPVEETPQEPVTTVEETVEEASPEIEQPPAENAEVVPTETSQPVEEMPQAVEGASQKAHPQEAPREAQQEIIVEPIAEQTECTEETPAEETAAESAENQGEA
jgi:hypothetical protein